tara:strand:- start:210 stop:353 length:144 start_codon:yes stop_codon:yes gene_type:complete
MSWNITVTALEYFLDKKTDGTISIEVIFVFAAYLVAITISLYFLDRM